MNLSQTKIKIDEINLFSQNQDKKIEELAIIIQEMQKHINFCKKDKQMLKSIIQDKEVEINRMYSLRRELAEYKCF